MNKEIGTLQSMWITLPGAQADISPIGQRTILISRFQAQDGNANPDCKRQSGETEELYWPSRFQISDECKYSQQ